VEKAGGNIRGSVDSAWLNILIEQGTNNMCTGMRLIASDNSVIHARTMEFAVDVHSKVIVSPRGYVRQGSTPDGKKGLSWKTKYANVGANALGLPIVVDGLNEMGLAMGLFYFPGCADYMPYQASDASKTLAPWELGSWILDNFASVNQVRRAIGEIVVANVVFDEWKMIPPVHFVVHDITGESIVIEYVGGKLYIHENPLGVMSNSPTFDWHMTNLNNYVNFSMTNASAQKLGSVTLTPFGQGSGMLGLPGDFTPPSRFVRIAAFSQSVLPSKTGVDAVLQAFHILNQFDIPKGAARDHEKDEHGNVIADYTIWTSANDLKAKRFYFRTYENSQIRMIDLTRLDLDAKDIVEFSMGGDEVIVSLTA